MRCKAIGRTGARVKVLAAVLAFAAASAAVALPNGLSGFSVGVGAGDPGAGHLRGEVGFLLSRHFCIGPGIGFSFGAGRAFYGGAAARYYFIPELHGTLQPHLAFGGGVARILGEEGVAEDDSETVPYLNLAAGCDVDVPGTPIASYLEAGGFILAGGETEADFKVEVGVRFGIGRVRRLEEEDRARAAEARRLEEERLARIAEEERVGAMLAEAEDAKERGDYAEAIEIYEEILGEYPDRAGAAELLEEAQRLQAEAYTAPTPRPRPVPVPEPEPEPEAPVISAEAIRAYEQGKAALAGGAISQAIYILSAVVREFPSYGAARAELVQAYLLQGLDSYSNGKLTAALQSWRRALAFDPGNAKIRRYIERAESELK